MPNCPICGKALKNPDSPTHINSKFHQDALQEQGNNKQNKRTDESEKIEAAEIKDPKIEISNSPEKLATNDDELHQEDKRIEEELEQLKESLLDDQQYLNVSELEFLKGYEGNIVDSLVEFLKTQEYFIEFEDLNNFFDIIEILLSFLTLEDISFILNRFDQETLREELKNKIFDYDLEKLAALPNSFDLIVQLVSQFLSQEDLLEFLINFDDLEETLEKSYYEVNDADNNPTTILIEKAIEAGLKNKNQDVYNNAIMIINTSGIFFEHFKKELLNTFRINEYITLKLVGSRTNIYVKGQLFNQCKYLLLNLQKDKFREYDSIGSIDEAIEKLDASMHGREGSHSIVDPETEFWGHCSNIQVWAENDYDTRILHRNLAFPLLRRLTEIGDPKAKKVYKDEIASRFQSNYLPVIEFIFAGSYLDALSKAEINSLVEEIDFDKFIAQTSHHKQSLLQKFAQLGSAKAKSLLSVEMRRQLHTAKLAEMRNILTRHRYTKLNREDISDLFHRFLKKSAKPGNDELKTYLLGDFARLNVQEAKPLFKEQFLKLLTGQKMTGLTTQPRYYHRRYNYQHPILAFLDVFTKQEMSEIFDLYITGIAPEAYNETTLAVISRFSDLGVQKAKDIFKKSFLTTIKSGDIATLQRLATIQHLKTLTKEEMLELSTEINFKERFSRNPPVILTLLERFYKAGYEQAKTIIRDSIVQVLKTPNESNINPVLNKSILKYLENEDLKSILEGEESTTVDVLLEIIRTSRRSSLRTKILNFFTLLKGASEKILSQKVKNALIKTDAESFHKLLKAKVLTLLVQQDKDVLYDHPKCKLRNFVVSHEGTDHVVDGRLNLDLRNQGLKDLTKVKGLSSLTHLESLDLRNNHLTTIIGIGNLTNLRKLRLQGNNFSEQFIRHLGGVDKYGNAKFPEKFIRYSKSLEEGGISYITIGTKNIEVFGDELDLKRLGIKKIADIQGLTKLKNIFRLDLSHNQIESVKGLETLTSLKVLNLSHNQLKSTAGLEKLVNLEELRMYGNGITDFPEREHLTALKIIDLDTRRKVSDRRYLDYLCESLNMEDLKQICRDHQIRGYSGLQRDRLMRFALNSLSEEEIRQTITKLEMKVINEGLELAIRKIEHKEREHVESISIRNPKLNEVELKFKGFNWENKSYVSITPSTINNPERYCDCRIGSENGFCSHFWAGVLFSYKAGFFKLSDWTLTPLPPKLEERLSSFKIITDASKNQQLINERDSSAKLVKYVNSRIHVKDAELTTFERRQYTWENRIVTYYLTTLKNIQIAPESDKTQMFPIDSLLVRFSDNMFLKYQLDRKNRISISGVVSIDSYLGFMLKNVFVEGSTLISRAPKVEQTKIIPSEPQVQKGELNINLNTIKDDLTGTWWHHISIKDFLLVQQIPVIQNYAVCEGDVLIHKQIKPGDQFPSIRYHVVQKTGAKLTENTDVKTLLANQLCQFVKEHECLPPSTTFAKEFKNGNMQINYAPSTHVKFSLNVQPSMAGVDRRYFQRSSKTVDAKQETEKSLFGAPLEKQWKIASDSDPSKSYTVTKQANDRWSCTCPHHVFRRATCKHILEAMRQNR